jgi:predicted regulator of Ras-like GTPase activity (Roadblock/LC7/MglB family)
MNFESELEGIRSRVPGAEAVALMGFDGIVVAESRDEGVHAPFQELGVEFSRLLKDASKVTVGNGVGDLGEMTVDAADRRFLMRVLTPEYFILLMLARDSCLGRGRYQLRRSASLMARELSS